MGKRHEFLHTLTAPQLWCQHGGLRFFYYILIVILWWFRYQRALIYSKQVILNLISMENASHIYCCCDVTTHSQSHYISVCTKIARSVPAMTQNMWTFATPIVILWQFRYQGALIYSKQVMLNLISIENASHIYGCCDVTTHSQSHYISVCTETARWVPANKQYWILYPWKNGSHIYGCCHVTAHSQSHYISVWTKIAWWLPAMTENMWTSVIPTVILWPFR